MNNDMIIQTKTFNMLAWLLPKTKSFPAFYRFTVTHRMTNAALDFQEHLFAAQSATSRKRKNQLQECDSALNRLRLYLRLAFEWQWLSVGQYEHISEMVAELGRLLGGWIKQETKK